jgi:hypothetical protein
VGTIFDNFCADFIAGGEKLVESTWVAESVL